MKKNQKCFTDTEFDSVKQFLSTQEAFKAFISEEKVLQNVFPAFENRSVYGGKL